MIDGRHRRHSGRQDETGSALTRTLLCCQKTRKSITGMILVLVSFCICLYGIFNPIWSNSVVSHLIFLSLRSNVYKSITYQSHSNNGLLFYMIQQAQQIFIQIYLVPWKQNLTGLKSNPLIRPQFRPLKFSNQQISDEKLSFLFLVQMFSSQTFKRKLQIILSLENKTECTKIIFFSNKQFSCPL